MPNNKSLSHWWLLLGCFGLAVAGLYSLVLVIARTPQLAKLPFFGNLFHSALVAHVDLSVLVWFLCIACLIWSQLTAGKKFPVPLVEEAALIVMALGQAAIALSPLDSQAPALMSNYIPVIHSPIFFVGLALILCSVLLILIKVIALPPPRAPLHFAAYSGALIAAIAMLAFYWSFRQMPREIDGQQYYDLLFWGGGHTLQYLHAQIAMIAWLLLLKALAPKFSLNNRWLWLSFSIAPLLAIATPLAYVFYNVAEQEHRLFFTNLMIVGGGLAPGFLALILIAEIWHARRKNALWSALFMSLVLFIYGGLLGGMIQGQNVVIPAHYHGSIVGITLAFMGLAYLLLPQFGYRNPAAWRLAYWQPIVYGSGQLMHITGLAVSGGYGVLRKTPGEVTDIALSVKIALGFMGLGGLIAIIGGLMFIIVVAKAVFCKN